MTLPASGNQSQGAQPPAQGGNEPQYITKAELDGKLEELKSLLGKNFQAVQSQTDRYQSKVQAALQNFEGAIKTLTDQGISIDPAMVKSAKQQVAFDAMTKGDLPAEQAPQEPAEEVNPQLSAYRDTVTAAAEQLMTVSGITLEDDDPEIEQFIEPAAEGTPKQYLEAITKAITAKRERLAKGVSPGALPSLTSGGSAASNSIQNIMDTETLWNLAMKDRK